MDEAQRLSDFRVLLPAYLPAPAYTLQSVEQFAVQGHASPAAKETILHYAAPGVRWIVIRERRNSIGRMEVPDAIKEGAVGGRPAAVFESTIAVQGQPNNELQVVGCIWEHGDILMDIRASGLSMAEITRVANSLR